MKSVSELEICEEMIQICHRLYDRNMLAGADGNLSYRISDERILMTPSGVPKAFLEPEQMSIVNLSGEILSGKPSSEKLMHLEIYRRCSKARAVIHAHPPHAVAWSVAQPEWKELPKAVLAEVILGTGGIPIVPFARPGTSEMGEVLEEFLPNHRSLILSRHGGLAWGEDFNEAMNGMERIEHTAQTMALAHQLGGLSFLPENEIEALKEMRKKIGERTL